MKSLRHSWLGAIALLLFGLHPSAGVEAPLPGETTPRRRLVVLIGADWAGRFAANARGYGGLGALHSYASARRAGLEAESGGLLLLHTGELTGAQSAGAARQILYPHGFDVLRYLSLDAALLSAREKEFVNSGVPSFARPWFVEYRDVAPNQPISTARPFPFRILSRAGFHVFVTGVLVGPKGAEVEGVRGELRRNRAADLRVVLLSEKPAAASKEAEPGAKTARITLTAGDSRTFAAGSPAKDPPPSAQVPSERLLEELWRLGRIRNIFEPLPSGRQSVGLVAYPSDANEVLHGSNGTLYCRIRSQSVCEVELILRAQRLVGLRARIFEPNSPDSPLPFLTPDPVLTRTYPAPSPK